jgi:hypothetical protein
VAAGKLLFFLDDTPHELSAGDMIAVPPKLPQTIHLLTSHLRLVGTFSPVRDDFLDAQSPSNP